MGHEVKLVNFVIFNPDLGPKEGQEEEKILFFSPPDTGLDKKVFTIGLSEAVVNFTSSFSIEPAQVVRTAKTRQYLLNPEGNYRMLMTIEPFQSEQDSETQTPTKEDSVRDTVYYEILRQAYDLFSLFMGSFERVLEDSDLSTLKYRVSQFFGKYVTKLKLKQCDLLDYFGGIHFLPVQKSTFLQIQSILNDVENQFSVIKHTVLLYNDLLVWSGLGQREMKTLYQYLTSSVLPKSLELDLSQPVSVKHRNNQISYGRYVIGPTDLQDTKATIRIPKIFISEPGSLDATEHHLVVYKSLSILLCMIIDTSEPLTLQLFADIDACIGPPLTPIASVFNEQYQKLAEVNLRQSMPSDSVATPLSAVRYIYFNRMNLAQKSTIHQESRRWHVGVSPEVMALLVDVHDDAGRLLPVAGVETDSEMIVKTNTNDCWVVGKRSDQREFYVIINQKNLNLSDVNEEIKKLCEQQFGGIFFLG